MSENTVGRKLQLGLVFAGAIAASYTLGSVLQGQNSEDLEEVCTPIITELEEVYNLRDEKRTRLETLLGQQELGAIPFGDQVVDYEYKAWQLQDAALDRRGDDLIREVTLLNCSEMMQED